jgi:hypothetical protein
MVPGVTSPGIGDDLVPWGNPYIVTIHLDYDANTWDSFYAFAHASEKPAPDEDSQNGLVKAAPTQSAAVFGARDRPSDHAPQFPVQG